MGTLDGRVAVVTGAGRGIGRAHALLLAAEGASVVVNDLGGSNTGEGSDAGPAQQVVDEIRAAGGTAVASTDDVADWAGAQALVDRAVSEFGRLEVVVNNAGILRDAFVAAMDETQFDSVIAVHLKGHFAVLHHAAAYWKQKAKAGEQVAASVINTASASGTFAVNAGQANYGAAKAGIAALTLVAAEELERYGRPGERDRPGGAHTTHPGHPGDGRDLRRRGARGGVRRVRSLQHRPGGGLPGPGEVPAQRKGPGRAGWRDPAAGQLEHRRDDRDRRALVD